MSEIETEEKYNLAKSEDDDVDYFSRISQESEVFHKFAPTAEEYNIESTKYEDFKNHVGRKNSESEELNSVLKYDFKNKSESENKSDFRLQAELPNVVKDGGVSWSKYKKKWKVERSIEGERILGGYFSDFEEAQRKSDDLVRKHEVEIGRESKHELNFPQNERAPKTFGVYWNKLARKWHVQRKFEEQKVNGGFFTDLEEAKCKADDLVHDYEAKFRKESKLKLNFPQHQENCLHDVNASGAVKRKRFKRNSCDSSDK